MKEYIFWGSLLVEVWMAATVTVFAFKEVPKLLKAMRQRAEWLAMPLDQQIRAPEKRPTFPFEENRDRIIDYMVPRFITGILCFIVVMKIFISDL